MTERNSLMYKIQMYEFAVIEAVLFLDTHPGDADAAAYLDENREKLSSAKTEYETKFGPLTCKGAEAGGSWSWLKDPWPWELSAN